MLNIDCTRRCFSRFSFRITAAAAASVDKATTSRTRKLAAKEENKTRAAHRLAIQRKKRAEKAGEKRRALSLFCRLTDPEQARGCIFNRTLFQHASLVELTVCAQQQSSSPELAVYALAKSWPYPPMQQQQQQLGAKNRNNTVVHVMLDEVSGK